MTPEIRVPSMTCSSCAATLERSLKTIPAAQTVSVNFRKETAIFKRSVNFNALLAIIEDEGYGATVVSG